MGRFDIAKHLNELDLSRLANRIIHHDARRYFLEPAGKEHYRLLAALSAHPSVQIALDIGTFRGCSALAMASCPKTAVVSFDVEDRLGLGFVYRENGLDPTNIRFIIDDVLKDEYRKLIQLSTLILVDTNHDGVFERKFYQHLVDLEWRGWLVLDDIQLNDEMRSFWGSITLPKDDMTYVGHWSGTGIVYFGANPTWIHTSPSNH